MNDAAAPLDHESMDGLRQLGQDVLDDMIDLYLEDTPPRLAALHAAVVVGDARQVREVAHTVKGSSANFGANLLADLCRLLEQHARQGDLTTAKTAISAIETEYDRVRTALLAQRT